MKTAALTVTCCLFAATKPAEAKPDMTDQTVSDKIDDELLYDPGVVSTKIDVSTSNGLVTLTGEVNNLLTKERSASIAETVKGVRAVVNRIDVSPAATRSDAQIRRDVESALLDDPATESYEITTFVEDGEATLTGTVDSYQERELVKTVAKGVRGVKSIDDQIDVDYKTDRTDTEIEKEIKQALRWNAHVDNYLINVSVNDDELIDYDRRAPLKTDSEIADSIESELWWSPFVDADEVTVSVEDGIATLAGTVDTGSERQSVTENAYEGGATLVDNDLVVNY